MYKKPYIIAEIGVNFYDTANELKISLLESAKLYILKAKEAGADCVKFQSYKADTLVVKNSPAYWDLKEEPTKTQYDLFLKHDSFGEKEFKELSAYAHKLKIDFISTPFDYKSADYLYNLIDFYKISSSDITNIPFIKYIGAKGKPVVISTGASYISEIFEAVQALEQVNCKDITLMHCVLSYPTKHKDANLNNIITLKKVFPKYKIGYSDHTKPDDSMQVISTSYLLGAQIIEKHFTLNKNLKGNDHYHAGDPSDFKKIRKNLKLIDEILGSFDKTVLKCEEVSRIHARRSLVLKCNKIKGERINKSDLAAKRPGIGISPKFQEVIIGKKLVKDVKKDSILTWDMI